jgi:integrase
METRSRKGGMQVYREFVLLNGRKINGPFFPRKTDAREWKRKQLALKNEILLHGEDYILKRESKFSDFSQQWLETDTKVHRALRTYQNYKSVLEKHFLPQLGDLLLKDIRKSRVDSIVSNLKKRGYAGKGINNIIGVLKVIMNEAMKQGYLLNNPLLFYPKCMEEIKGDNYFSKSEIMQLLMANFNEELFSLYLVALNTGARRGDFQTRQISITRTRDRNGLSDTTKTKLKRVIPMNDEVYQTLLDLRRKQLNPRNVFCHSNGVPVDPNHVYRFFKKAQRRAGISRELRFHDLRHTYASHFMMNGGNVFDLQKILGHSKIEMTMRYAHFSPEHLKEAVKTVSFSLGSHSILMEEKLSS